MFLIKKTCACSSFTPPLPPFVYFNIFKDNIRIWGNSVLFAPLEHFKELKANGTSDLDPFLGAICYSPMLPSNVQCVIRRIHTIHRKRTNCI